MWYSEVSRNISKIPDAVAFFNTELADAKREVKLTGNVERASSAMPGIVEHRFNQLQEIEAILNYLNIITTKFVVFFKVNQSSAHPLFLSLPFQILLEENP